MRRPRKHADEPSPFIITSVSREARELITTSDPPHEGLAEDFFNHPPIVRIQPLAEQDDETLANVRAAWEERGAHVRMLAREHVKPEVVAAVPAQEQKTVREMVLGVMQEVRSDSPELLKKLVLETLEMAGV